MRNSPNNFVDPLGLYSSDEFLGDATNFSAGFGDALLLGMGPSFRGALDINVVNQSTMAYKAGSWASFSLGAARLGYAGLAKGASMMASSGVQASVYREGLKNFFRLGIGSSWRKPNLAKYLTDETLRAAAGRTNLLMNTYGAGVAVAGAAGATADNGNSGMCGNEHK